MHIAFLKKWLNESAEGRKTLKAQNATDNRCVLKTFMERSRFPATAFTSERL
jgi:hypothetical protein